MLAALETFLHRARRRLNRSEWAIHKFGLSTSEGTAEAPGLLLIQVDGLSRQQVEAAMAAGRMPFLRRLREQGRYPLRTFYSGLPSTTPAVQAELYYGVRAGVPAFGFMDRDIGEIGMMFYPEWAKRFEGSFAAQAEGLLKGGSSWSNIYSGGADSDESNFCSASIGFGDTWRSKKIRHLTGFLAMEAPAVLRIGGLVLLEFLIGLGDAIAGIFKGQWISQELGMLFSRMCVGIGLREVVTIGAKIDVARGLPIVHVNFLGYDELSHRRGPDSHFAHWSLRGIDWAIQKLFIAAHQSQRRDYSVWVFSDHGQERCRSFATEFPGGIEAIIKDCLGMDVSRNLPHRSVRTERHPMPAVSRSARAEKWRELRRSRAALTPGERETFAVIATGPIGHVYFGQPMDGERKGEAARVLVKKGGVPGVLFRRDDGANVWVHGDDEEVLGANVSAVFQNHPEELRETMARDLELFCNNRHSGDLILLGWSGGEDWTFAPERGAHAGLSPQQVQGFFLAPPEARLPDGAERFVRPSALREAARALLGRTMLSRTRRLVRRTPEHLRVMSYNVHGCSGMDGRVSPRRIARVIEQQEPDIVAVQELDHGRFRSRGEDQAGEIAAVLGYHVTFCVTVVKGAERYGHAILSRWPLETKRVADLPTDDKSWWPEPRGALWSRVMLGSVAVNVLTTHLGLSARERLEQMRQLLGEGWLDAIPEEEAVILCGDLNLLPGSVPHRMAADRLYDVAKSRRRLRTFSASRPFARLDHIFVSAQFETAHVEAVRNDLTRVASDHLPLVADLRLVEKGKPG